MSNRKWKWSHPSPRKVIIPKEEIIRLYNEGKTMSEVSKKLNTTKRVIQLRMEEYGIPRREMVGKNHGSWKGGRVIKMGYWAIWKPDHLRANNVGYVKEHILVMEKHLGREIKKEEHIHHEDFDRKNNDVDNLWLCNNKVHLGATKSIFKLVNPLMKKGIIKFNRIKGIYELAEKGNAVTTNVIEAIIGVLI